MRHPLIALRERLSKIGIEIGMSSNYPWVYLDTVNGNRVTEIYQSDHYFTIGFMSIRDENEFRFTNLKEIFLVIRKYLSLHK
jgi:hypothetical protein